MTPEVRISIGGTDITGRFGNRIVELTVTDEAGIESDQVEVVIDDANGSVAAPRVGVALSVAGGYRETGLRTFGSYTVDQVDFEGWPQRVVILGRAADWLSRQKERRIEHWEDTTLGQIVQTIAGRNGLTARVGGGIGAKTIEYEGQAEESDLAFLSRLARRYDGTLSVKDGNLILVPRAGGRTAGGLALPQVTIRPGFNLLGYRVSEKEKPGHQKTEGHFFDRNKVEKVIKEAGSGAPSQAIFRLREPFQNEDEAQDAAEARSRELERARGAARFEIVGTPGVLAEVPVLASGIRDRVDGLWMAQRVEHRFSAAGYRTSIECEKPNSGGGGA